MGKLYGPVMQMGFVVDNFEEPIKHWTEKLNVGPFFILEHLDLKYFHYKGNKSVIDFSVALSFSGNTQIELIKQHCDTPSIYNEYSNIKKGSLHIALAINLLPFRKLSGSFLSSANRANA